MNVVETEETLYIKGNTFSLAMGTGAFHTNIFVVRTDQAGVRMGGEVMFMEWCNATVTVHYKETMKTTVVPCESDDEASQVFDLISKHIDKMRDMETL